MLTFSVKKKNTWLLLLPLFFSFISLFFVQIANAAGTATVTSTVTVQNVSVSVADGTVSYGTLGTNTSESTLAAPGLGDQQTATNNGNVAEDFNIKGSNSANWILDTANSTADHYVHKFCVATCGTDASPTNFTALTTSYAALGAGNVATSGTQTFDLRITTPQTSSVFTSQSIDVTIQAVAH